MADVFPLDQMVEIIFLQGKNGGYMARCPLEKKIQGLTMELLADTTASQHGKKTHSFPFLFTGYLPVESDIDEQ